MAQFIAIAVLFILSVSISPGADNTPVAVIITKQTPIETLSSNGDVLSVGEAKIGTRLNLLGADGSQVTLQDAQGIHYRIAQSSTDYTSATAVSSTATNASQAANSPAKPVNPTPNSADHSATAASSQTTQTPLTDSLTFPLLPVDSNGKPAIVFFDFVPQLKADFDKPEVLRRHYDEVLLVTCLQAIVNRDQPRLFVRYNAAPDDYWFSKMRAPGEWMAGRQLLKPHDVQELLALFPDTARGLIAWDERVPATSNVAATVAGVENLLAIRYDESSGSLYTQLTSGPNPWKVTRRLLADDGTSLFTGKGFISGTTLPSSGSAKNDAYLWLLENYIKTGKTNPRVLGYYIDADWLRSWKASGFALHTLNNLDYILANRGVVFDLDLWDDEAPVDDPGEPPGTDAATLKKILRACYDGVGGKEMIACHGFTPWAFKYTGFKSKTWDAGGKHEGVGSEWKMVEILSAYNVYVDADAIGYSSMVNASFYQHYPLPAVVSQGPQPTRESLIKQGILDPQGKLLPVNYYAHYQGDYDSAAWFYWQVPKMWDDPVRGTMPLSWAMNPNLGERFPFGLDYVRKTAKPGEVWVAGEGAGYVMPANLQEPRPISGLPDGLQVWADHCKREYAQWDIHVTSFDIDGFTPALSKRAFEAYKQFSPGGIGVQNGRGPGGKHFGVIDGVPFITHWGDLPGNEGSANLNRVTGLIQKEFSTSKPGAPSFHLFRSILQKPSFYANIEHGLDGITGLPPRKLVDLPTLLWLVKEYCSESDKGNTP